jgi:hypothetical protein
MGWEGGGQVIGYRMVTSLLILNMLTSDPDPEQDPGAESAINNTKNRKVEKTKVSA